MSLESSSASITPISIFLEADIVVQSVIIILLFASVFSWGVMLSRTIAIAVERRKVKAVSEILSSVEKLDELREIANNGNGKVHSILRSLAGEWKWSNDYASRNYEEIRQRIIAISEISVDRQYVRLARNSAWLATISYTAPFIGLFGTVWGIMNSFVAMGQAQDTSLATVAPGMAEALFATAVGLFCAIPASLGYNRIVQALLATDQEWRAIIGRVEVAISRHYGVVRRPL